MGSEGVPDGDPRRDEALAQEGPAQAVEVGGDGAGQAALLCGTNPTENESAPFLR